MDDAGNGVYPSADGKLEILEPPPGKVDAVVAFTAHTFIATSIGPDEILSQVDPSDLSRPMSAVFLTWLGLRLGATPGLVDIVLVRHGTQIPPKHLTLTENLIGHPRVDRALRMRDDVQVWADATRTAIVSLGRGLVGRWELSVEISGEARGQGLSRQLIDEALGLIPTGEPVFAQIAPGNARSVRAFLAAGFRPIGAEVLFPIGRPE